READLIWWIVRRRPVITNPRVGPQPSQDGRSRNDPRHPGIAADNHQTIDVDMEGDRGDRPPEDRIFPLAPYGAVGILGGRQREIGICSRWWDNVGAANAHLVNDVT